MSAVRGGPSTEGELVDDDRELMSKSDDKDTEYEEIIVA